MGVLVLWNLSVNADNQVKIAAAGGIESILNAMKQYAQHESVQKQGCGALWNLAANADNKVKIAAAGGIESILNAMKQHAQHESVQKGVWCT